MKKRVLCVEIGISAIKICEVEYKFHKGSTMINLLNYLTLDTPLGCVSVTELFELDTLSFKLKEVLESNKIKTKDVVFTINSPNIHGREMVIPFQKTSAQIIELVEAKAITESKFPVELHGNILTYSTLEHIYKNIESTEDRKKKTVKEHTIDIMAYLAPEALVKSYSELARLCKLRMMSCDYVGNSSYRLISTEFKTGTYMTVQVTEFNSILSIVSNGILKSQRVVDFKYSSVSEEFTSRSKLFGVSSPSEAFKLITDLSLFEVTTKDLPKLFPKCNDLDLDEIEKTLDDVKEKILSFISSVSSFTYFYKQENSGAILDKIIYINENQEFPDIIESLQYGNTVPVNALDSLIGISFNSNRYPNLSLVSLVNCLGAGIEPTNFNISESDALKQSILFKKVALGSVIVTLGISSLLVMGSTFSLNKVKTENKVLKDKIADASLAQSIYSEYSKAKATLGTVTVFDISSSTVLNNSDLIFDNIEAVTPVGCVDYTSVVGTTDELTLSITADCKNTVALLIEGLEKTGDFTSVNITSITESINTDGITYKTGRVVTASINCRFVEVAIPTEAPIAPTLAPTDDSESKTEEDMSNEN